MRGCSYYSHDQTGMRILIVFETSIKSTKIRCRYQSAVWEMGRARYDTGRIHEDTNRHDRSDRILH